MRPLYTEWCKLQGFTLWAIDVAHMNKRNSVLYSQGPFCAFRSEERLSPFANFTFSIWRKPISSYNVCTNKALYCCCHPQKGINRRGERFLRIPRDGSAENLKQFSKPFFSNSFTSLAFWEICWQNLTQTVFVSIEKKTPSPESYPSINKRKTSNINAVNEDHAEMGSSLISRISFRLPDCPNNNAAKQFFSSAPSINYTFAITSNLQKLLGKASSGRRRLLLLYLETNDCVRRGREVIHSKSHSLDSYSPLPPKQFIELVKKKAL